MIREGERKRIQNLKNEIDDIKEYLSSDYCKQCLKMYGKLQDLESELKDLEKDERNR